MIDTGARKRIELEGVVQGVGFRPFVYRIATHFGLGGYVLNSSDGVVIEAEGDGAAVDRFLRALEHELPALARVDARRLTDVAPRGEQRFVIRDSVSREGAFAIVPPDIATCGECLRETLAPTGRRRGYAFTNCTACGPRYTIVRDVPYDRARTTMAAFGMCAACRAEYENPADRRFHAEPIACPDCGPSLALLSGEELARLDVSAFDRARSSGDVIHHVRELLGAGEIVAIKGLGGFHLACDAANERAVARLRERKRRSEKPFAVMVADVSVAERLCEIGDVDRALLSGSRRPIVLLPRRNASAAAPRVASSVAPGVDTLGVMLPYTPLHHLLFDGSPAYDVLVMTSGNLSEEPIVSRNDEAWPRLGRVADHFLLHDREIAARTDDSVVRVVRGRVYPLRRSRGFAPDPIDLGMPVGQVLACGAGLKNTLCLTKGRYAVVSQHIGDLDNVETMENFRETLEHLARFFRITPAVAAHDLHPDYLSTRFALDASGLPTVAVQHHHAHVASCMADNGLRGRVIGVAFDGTGYGTDGKVWGGEFLTCDYAGFERRGHFRYVPLPGGDGAAREPWRMALAYLRTVYGDGVPAPARSLLDGVAASRLTVVEQILARGVRCTLTSSCGRFFDAVSSILGVRHENTYEGQAAIELEAIASRADAGGRSSYPFMVTDGDPFEVDFRDTIDAVVRERTRHVPVADVSARVHATVTRAVVEGCRRVRERDGLGRVCLSGGSFQNMRLLEGALAALSDDGFEVFIHHRVPCNDGGLSLGQAVIASEGLSP